MGKILAVPALLVAVVAWLWWLVLFLRLRRRQRPAPVAPTEDLTPLAARMWRAKAIVSVSLAAAAVLVAFA